MSLLSAQTQRASRALVESTQTPFPVLRHRRGCCVLVINRNCHGGGGGWRALSASHGRGETQEESAGDDSGSSLPLSAEEAAFRRRIVAGAAVGAVIALGANFLGVTSAILTLDSQLARRLKLDVVYPVKGFKRCIENSKGFEFVYPAEWVGDQRLLYKAVERAERERSLDLPPLLGKSKGKAREFVSSTEPIVAFGPPGTDGQLNVSVVVAPVYPGFRLELLGGPEEAGALILTKFIAPQGSGKLATLLSASRRQGSRGSGDVYYTLEYTVRANSFFRHNVAVYCASSGLLYSLNSQASEDTWTEVKDMLQEVANSFTVGV